MSSLASIIPLVSIAQTSMSLRPDGPNFVAPGLPFQAERISRSIQNLSDGSTLAKETREIFGRDAEGQFYYESHSIRPENSTVFHVIADPVIGRIYQWTSQSTEVISQNLSRGTHFDVTALAATQRETPYVPKDKLKVVTENLGSKKIAGLAVTGTRTVTTIPIDAIGNAKEILMRHDVWLSTELQIVMEDSDVSPFTGTRTAEIVSVKQVAPEANLFRLPAGLPVKTRNLPGMDLERLGYVHLLGEIEQPEKREQAASALVSYARTHAEVANHVAHVLAAKKTHLEDADELGRKSVERLESSTVSVHADRVTRVDLQRAELLAEYWDSLGWVRYVQGDLEAAKRYCTIAWGLGGEGLYAGHVARIAQKNGDLETARHLLQVAMSGKMDNREKAQTANELARLGVDHPEAIKEPAVVSVPGVNVDGSADFYLVFAAKQQPEVKFLSGDSLLVAASDAIAKADFPIQMPDDGPERVVRQGRLVCAQKGCKMTLLYAWEAVEAQSSSPNVTSPFREGGK